MFRYLSTGVFLRMLSVLLLYFTRYTASTSGKLEAHLCPETTFESRALLNKIEIELTNVI